MPKYQFEGIVTRMYSGEVEADNEEAAREEIEDGMRWDDFEEEFGPDVEIQWMTEVAE